jgi:hypothetical protein
MSFRFKSQYPGTHPRLLKRDDDSIMNCERKESYETSRGLGTIWGSHGGEYEDRPNDGGSKDLWNVGKLLPDYTVLQPRRQQSSSRGLS